MTVWPILIIIEKICPFSCVIHDFKTDLVIELSISFAQNTLILHVIQVVYVVLHFRRQITLT
jgi:hypothetical protein